MSAFDTTGSGHLPVGGPVRFSNDPDTCTHADRNVCPQCAELTEAEAQAVREYLELQQNELERRRREVPADREWS